MRGTPHAPSHGGVRAPPPCPGGPVQGPGECAHGGVRPTGNEEEAGKACCPDSTQDTPQGAVSACHGAQHTRLRPRAPRTSASEAAGGPGAQHGRTQRASHWIWLMRGTPHPPSHGGVTAPPPCPGGPVQGPGECAHGGVSPTGNEEEAGKACCPDSTQDTPQGAVSACHGAQHTRLRPRAPRTSASEAARGPGAQHGRTQRFHF
ncbi:proline-rich proteoglycan 2-like isoform X2 [Cervus elaphus]|uniref:proline-rich proteoglycan 2-like isoform X2 n=1 Tax=Cervus elaphus TaxID=9860 RepID=UPI001CC2DB55|nr:proline-rich proteoglycan 2-like isoform X2 [Cervus elaphus]